MGINGYIYYIRGFERYVNSSVELNRVKCFVLYPCSLTLVELPPSTVRRGRPIPEGRTLILWSNTSLVSLLCQWIFFLSLTFNFNLVNILEEHGCPTWSLALWSIRVDPCPKSPYLYIYFINLLYILSTNIIISILNSSKICCATWSHCGHAWMAHHSEELEASKSICYCPLTPYPLYLLIISLYYITYIFLNVYSLPNPFYI